VFVAIVLQMAVVPYDFLVFGAMYKGTYLLTDITVMNNPPPLQDLHAFVK